MPQSFNHNRAYAFAIGLGQGTEMSSMTRLLAEARGQSAPALLLVSQRQSGCHVNEIVCVA